MENVFRPDHLWIGDYNIVIDEQGALIAHLTGATKYRVPAVKSITAFISKHMNLCQALAGIAPMTLMQPFRVDVERVIRRPRRRRRAGNVS